MTSCCTVMIRTRESMCVPKKSFSRIVRAFMSHLVGFYWKRSKCILIVTSETWIFGNLTLIKKTVKVKPRHFKRGHKVVSEKSRVWESCRRDVLCRKSMSHKIYVKETLHINNQILQSYCHLLLTFLIYPHTQRHRRWSCPVTALASVPQQELHLCLSQSWK